MQMIMMVVIVKIAFFLFSEENNVELRVFASQSKTRKSMERRLCVAVSVLLLPPMSLQDQRAEILHQACQVEAQCGTLIFI